MMVLFQNKIIFMPGMPPGTRNEEIQDYARGCLGVSWEEVHIRSGDGTKLVLAVAFPPRPPAVVATTERHIYVLYLQGNAASMPPRLPALSAVLSLVRNASGGQTRHTMVAVGYRGYWKSKGRASEGGINDDVMAALRWVIDDHSSNDHGGNMERPVIILWGHSVGAGFATNLVARLIRSAASEGYGTNINSLILETPFTSTRAMLETLYPQKWLPYRHLWPFLRTRLDSSANMETIATRSSTDILMLVAEKDEIVPRHLTEALRQRGENLGLCVKYHIVPGSYHNEASSRGDGRQAIASFVLHQSQRK